VQLGPCCCSLLLCVLHRVLHRPVSCQCLRPACANMWCPKQEALITGGGPGRRARIRTTYFTNPTPSTLHPQPYTRNPTPSTLHPRPYTLNPAPSTLHPQPYTLNPTPSTLHPQPYKTWRQGKRTTAGCSKLWVPRASRTIRGGTFTMSQGAEARFRASCVAQVCSG